MNARTIRKQRIEIADVSNGKTTARPKGYVFLSPEWIREVAQAVELARSTNLYFKNLSAGLSFSMAYLVRNLPPWLKLWYDGADQAVIFSRFHKGAVRQLEIGRELPDAKIELLLASDYKAAERLFLGKSSPMSSFLNGHLKVEPVNGFRRWPKLAATSVLAAGMALKSARHVPTVFAHKT